MIKKEKKCNGTGYHDFIDGWNAFVNGEAFDMTKTVYWKDGWTDCNEAEPVQRNKIK